jgi:hypothetical protein
MFWSFWCLLPIESSCEHSILKLSISSTHWVHDVNTQILKLSVPVTHRARTVNVANNIWWCYSVGRELAEFLMEPNLLPHPQQTIKPIWKQDELSFYAEWNLPNYLQPQPMKIIWNYFQKGGTNQPLPNFVWRLSNRVFTIKERNCLLVI